MGSGSNGRSAPALSVRLLGGFSVLAAGEAVPVDSMRVQSLLAHLVLHQGEDQPRERLAYLFWPESGRIPSPDEHAAGASSPAFDSAGRRRSS